MHFQASRLISILKDIINIPSPCGYTYEISQFIKEFSAELGFDIYSQQREAFCIKIEGQKSKYTPIVCSHFDTLGAMVSSIKDNGRLGFSKIAFYHLSVIETENVWVITSSGKKYRGTCMYNKPTTHLYSQQELDEKRTLDNMEIRLDVEARSKSDLKDLGISVGDYIVFDTRFEYTDTGFVKSRYLDDKSAVAIMLYLLELFSKKEKKDRILSYFYFSDLEEIGYGANLNIPVECNLFLALDLGVIGKDLMTDEYKVSICVKDAVIPYSYNVNKYLVDICKEKNLDFSLDVFPNYGSDIMPALQRGFGGQFALFGPGVAASHSYERTHEKGLLNTLKLLYSMLTDIK